MPLHSLFILVFLTVHVVILPLGTLDDIFSGFWMPVASVKPPRSATFDKICTDRNLAVLMGDRTVRSSLCGNLISSAC